MKVGDKIMLVDFIARGLLHRVTVTDVVGLAFVVRAQAGWTGHRDITTFGDYAREGVGWCHGWEGEAVDALLAVQALS